MLIREGSNRPTTPSQIKMSQSAVTSGGFKNQNSGFIFQVTSLETRETLTFLNPLMENMDHDISSGEDGFSRPFAPMQHAQSVEAPRQTYTWPSLYLDIRYRQLTAGEKPRDIEYIVNKLISWVTPDMTRMRKHRISVKWGLQVIGKPPKDYLYINSIRPVAQQYDDNGKMVTALLTLSATLYGFQKSGPS